MLCFIYFTLQTSASSQVIDNQQFFDELFENKEIDDDDILDFLEITRGGRGGMDTGKTQTFDMLCGLANVCKRYLQRDHFIEGKLFSSLISFRMGKCI